ncbi:MAG: helix-turn-helix domain-containing protein [Bacteroidota bacterium]
MSKNAFLLQLGVKTLGNALDIPFTAYFKEISRASGIDQINKLGEQFTTSLANLSVQDSASISYFLYLSENGLLHHLYRHQEEGFFHLLEVVQHRLTALKANYTLEFNPESLEVFLEIVEAAFRRIKRTISVERFEEDFLNKLDWSSLNQNLIGPVSSCIAYTYAQEPQAEQRAKARLWYMKSMQEESVVDNLNNLYCLADFFLQYGNGDKYEQVQRLIDRIAEASDEEEDARIQNIMLGLVLELKAKVLYTQTPDAEQDEQAFAEGAEKELSALQSELEQMEDLSYLQQLRIGAINSQLYAKLFHLLEDEVDQNSFAKKANQGMEQVLMLADSGLDDQGIFQYRLAKARISIETEQSQTEKELKEINAYYKRQNDFEAYLQSIQSYLRLLERNGNGAKAFELLQDAFKYANRKHEQGQGGFSLSHGLFQLMNDILLVEICQPGVSWAVEYLDQLFGNITEAIDRLEEEWEVIGKSLTEAFRSEFHRFEPISHFNIKVYLLYQLYEIKVMRLGALISGDQLSLKIGDRLLAELGNRNNPLSFVKTDWEEFKNVPNHVRNSTLNKCIDISKGDLPLAAEHLEFSYRNLRSYITFKEVNRLGNFLDLKLTNNAALENGIRLMFFDLYRNGTIFEVVFDMPKFLVEHTPQGFFSSDLEEDLNIKGTTAKKYIKIMAEVGLITQDKNMGRKHFYRVNRDTIMKRLGKDQATMIKPQS